MDSPCYNICIRSSIVFIIRSEPQVLSSISYTIFHSQMCVVLSLMLCKQQSMCVLEFVSPNYSSLILSLSPSFLRICFLRSVNPHRDGQRRLSTVWSGKILFLFSSSGLKGRGNDDLESSTFSFVCFSFISFWPGFALMRTFSVRWRK